ncbi:MAG: hypothetical protein Kow0062_13650 [Acidobacteriota bacterium]|nr:MAG: helix-turn-helix domain-containing protein [Acidobacteriota bacterium]
MAAPDPRGVVARAPTGRRRREATPIKGSPRLGSYLRSLRQGYGFSLRKVEERARQHGGEIDNSQLSRYEKGLCYPSFDKLRTLARIFNVTVQTFSDVVDLEELERQLPEGDDAQRLFDDGQQAFRVGDYADAYAHFQKVRLLLEPDEEFPGELTARARLSAAIALFRMGKVSLCEFELRQLLRRPEHLDPGLVVRALLQLSNAHAALGDLFLAEIEAERSLRTAEQADDPALVAYAHHALGHVLQDRGDLEAAVGHYDACLRAYREIGDEHGALKVRLNLGQLYAARGQFEQGRRMLQETHDAARRLGHRWTVARAAALLGEIHARRGEAEAARRHLRESNAVASGGDVQFTDILFVNAFYTWRLALDEGNEAEARIAFGRLKYLRPQLEELHPEVREFDRLIEEGGRP